MGFEKLSEFHLKLQKLGHDYDLTIRLRRVLLIVVLVLILCLVEFRKRLRTSDHAHS